MIRPTKWATLVVSVGLGACTSQVPLDNSPCPCPASLGYSCCGSGSAARCIRVAAGETCSTGPELTDARPSDGGLGDAGNPDLPTISSSIGGIAVGRAHACGVREFAVSCIGDNSKGQATPPEGQFYGVVTGPDSDFNCASKVDKSNFNKDGMPVCWGDNTYGQISLPAGVKNVVAAGARHACGTDTDGAVVCWGDNSYGQATPPAGPLIHVTAGRNHTCAVKWDGTSVETGTIVCWGDNSQGQLDAPKVHLWSLMWMGAGGDHTCVTDWSYQVWCWGDHSRGQSTPPVGSAMGGISVAAGHACAIIEPDSKVVCWGDDWGTAKPVPPSGQFNNIFVGDNLNCFESAGSVDRQPPICWGTTYEPWY